MRMCQRFVMWKLGLGDAFFESLDTVTSTPLPETDDVLPLVVITTVNHVPQSPAANVTVATMPRDNI